jgi:hypothetical protein
MRRSVSEKIVYGLCVVGDAAIDGRWGLQRKLRQLKEAKTSKFQVIASQVKLVGMREVELFCIYGVKKLNYQGRSDVVCRHQRFVQPDVSRVLASREAQHLLLWP